MSLATAKADQIVLNNGDRITGQILNAQDGTLTILSPIAGKIIVDLKNVKTFSTDGPIKILLNDGNQINQTISEGPDGSFSTAPGGTLAVQPIPINKIDKINPLPVTWTGSLVVNGLYAQGNTESEQLGVTFDAMRRSDVDRITAGAGYLFGEQKINGVESTTEDDWYLRAAYNLFFTERLYGFVDGRVEKDRILNLDIRVTPSAGLGYQWVETPKFNLSTEAGIAYVYEDFTNEPTPNQNLSAKVAYHVDKTLFDSSLKLFQDVVYFPSIQNTSKYLLLTSSGLHVAMSKNMFSELKAEIDYDSNPAPGSRRTDERIILGVGWTF